MVPALPLDVPLPPSPVSGGGDGACFTTPSVSPAGLCPTAMVWVIVLVESSQYSSEPLDVVTYATVGSMPAATSRTRAPGSIRHAVTSRGPSGSSHVSTIEG